MTDEKKPDEARPEHVGRTIKKETEVQASPEEVWRAWADPERISQWFPDRAEGEAKPGSVMKWVFDAFGFEQPVPIVGAKPGVELLIAGEIPGRPPFMQEVRIETSAGRTILRVLQSGFGDGAEWDDEYEGVDSGWEMAVATLRHWLESYGTNDRCHLFHMRPAQFEYDSLQPLFETASGLESWLATEAEVEAPLRVGDPVRMELGELGPLNGHVLARTPREVLLSWPELRAVIGLKCFSMGPGGRMLAVDFNAWPLEDSRRAPVDAFLAKAIDRLAALMS